MLFLFFSLKHRLCIQAMGTKRSLADWAQVNKTLSRHPSRCILGLYVKPTWRLPALEHLVRSVGVFLSLKPPVDPAPFQTRWGTWAPMDPGEPTVLAGPQSGPKWSPPCGDAGAGCWAVPFCSVEVWVYIRLWSSASSSTWPRRRPR